MTFWPLTNSDFPTDQTFHQFHDLYTELDLHRIMSGFHGAYATGVASQQGTLTLPDTWFRPPFWDLLMLQLLRPNSSNLPCLYSTFHLKYPLVLSRFCFERFARCCFRSMYLLPFKKYTYHNTSPGERLDIFLECDGCLGREYPVGLGIGDTSGASLLLLAFLIKKLSDKPKRHQK